MYDVIARAYSATAAVWLIPGLLIFINLAATRRIMLNTLAEPGQKLLQTIFVWLAPGIGAATVYAVLSEPKAKGSGHYPPENSLGDDPNIGFRNSANDYFKD
jgi:hypothetical protein